MSDSELDLDLEESDDAESDLGGFEMPSGFDPSAAMGKFGAGAQIEEEDDVIEEPQADHLDLDLVMDVPVTMEVILGSSTMTVANILKLGRGAVVVNGRIVARGEIVVIDKEEQRFGITLTDVAKPGSKLQARKPRAA